MRTKIVILAAMLLLIFVDCVEAQDHHTFVCGYSSSTKPNFCDFVYEKHNITDQGTLKTVKAIVDLVSLPQNFVLVHCSNIDNAFAYCSPTGTRYIIVDDLMLTGMRYAASGAHVRDFNFISFNDEG